MMTGLWRRDADAVVLSKSIFAVLGQIAAAPPLECALASAPCSQASAVEAVTGSGPALSRKVAGRALSAAEETAVSCAWKSYPCSSLTVRRQCMFDLPPFL